MFDKNKLAETFNSYFVNIGSKLRTSIPENKNIQKLHSLRKSLPQYHQSDGLITGKYICEPQNKRV